MRDQHFYGLSSITSNIVRNNNNTLSSLGNNIQAGIRYAPMHNNNYIQEDVDIYLDDPLINLPMHADLAYNQERKKEVGEVSTKLREYANELMKHVKYAMTDDIFKEPWKGNDEFMEYNVTDYKKDAK